MERVPDCPAMRGQQSSLSTAKDVMLQCTFGLRFSATSDDVYWAANIRRFVISAFDDPLFNSITVQGTRYASMFIPSCCQGSAS